MQRAREIPFIPMFSQAAVFLTLSAPKAKRRVFEGGLGGPCFTFYLQYALTCCH